MFPFGLTHLLTIRAKNGTLVNQRGKWFIKFEITSISENLCYESCIYKMHTTMLCTTDILVNRKHLIDKIWVKCLLVISCIRISQHIPRGTHESIHGVHFASCFLTTARTNSFHKAFASCQRRFAIWFEIHIIREKHRKLFIRNKNFSAIITVDNRDRCSPVSLTRNQPVSQTICNLFYLQRR